MHKAAYTYIRQNGLRCHLCLQMSQNTISVPQNSAHRMCLLCNRMFCRSHSVQAERENKIPWFALEDEDTVEEEPFLVCEIDHETYYHNHSAPGVFKSMPHWRWVKGEEVIRAYAKSRWGIQIPQTKIPPF